MTTISYMTDVLFAVGAVGELKILAARHGIARPLIVTDAGVVAAGLTEPLLVVLGSCPIFDETPANPTEEAVERAQALFGHRRKRVAVLLVPALADRQRLPFDLEPLARGGGLHHLDALWNDFEADIIAQQDSNSQAHSSTTMPTSSTSRFQLAISFRSHALGSSSEVRVGTTMPPRSKASCVSGAVIALAKA